LLATIIAYFLGLTYYLTAGILAAISIQKTKTLSIQIAFKRLILVLISIFISNLLFASIGFHLYSYVLFIIVIVVVSFRFDLNEGTVPSIVVVTHIYAHEVYSLEFSLETLSLFLIAITTALLFNFFYPSESMITLEKYRENLDMAIKDHIIYLSDKLMNEEKTCQITFELEHHIEEIIKLIDQTTGDLVMRNHQGILAYTLMRKKQFDILKNICATSDALTNIYPQTKAISRYLKSLSNDIGKKNRADFQRTNLDDLLCTFKNNDLPKSREEFENRAALYHIVLSLQQFLQLKMDYHKEYTFM
jgi:uncharacterized membrane protein YgaE (UPF0421/DUF939 family)